MNIFINKHHVLVLSLLLIGAVVSCNSVSRQRREKSYAGHTMGTTFSIKLVETGSYYESHPALLDSIHAILERVNQQMSTYIDSSEISRFNDFKADQWMSVSEDFASVVHTALRISRQSEGAFDVTVNPLVNLWGFGSGNSIRTVPLQQAIDSALTFVGYENCRVRFNPPALKKTVAGLQCDLGAIAKGYAVDKVSEFLERTGTENHLVEIGGEIRARGKNENHVNWRIGIQSPDGGNRVQKIISLENIAIATSGDYRNYFEENGVRYSHTIDPRTGRPIQHKLAAVTVLHDSCTVADAYATALDVMGPEDGYDLAVKENLPVLLLIKSKDGFVEKMTPEFEMYMKK
ncbi:MAG: FAD:protein FMN transferase [candidate division KSB1 bacterium]|nr:FAD:protein FMN transferase [candidate division KSB1 bacterium]